MLCTQALNRQPFEIEKDTMFNNELKETLAKEYDLKKITSSHTYLHQKGKKAYLVLIANQITIYDISNTTENRYNKKRRGKSFIREILDNFVYKKKGIATQIQVLHRIKTHVTPITIDYYDPTAFKQLDHLFLKPNKLKMLYKPTALRPKATQATETASVRASIDL